MKKIQYILTSLALLATAVSCTLNKLEEPAALDRDGKGTEVTFTAMAPGEAGTKTMVSETGPDILWQDADEILIFFGADKFEFRTTLENPAPQAEFRGSIPGFTASIEESSGASHTFWAVYPFNWEKTSREGESVTVYVPDSQTAVAGSYDPAALVSVACSNNLMLGFYNVCGGLKFRLLKEGIQQVEFHANGDKPLAGNATVKMDGDGFPVVTDVQDPVSSIILTAPFDEPFKPGTWYYLTCLPGALDQGWTLTFRSETETGVLEHPASAEVKRSVWGVLENPEAGANFYPESNVFWNVIRYTTTDGNTIVPRYVGSFSYPERNALIENIYENGQGRMVFEKPITEIPDNAFYNYSTLETVQLPGTVKTIGASAFRSNENLREVRLSNGVEEIYNYAFAYNPLLESVRIPASLQYLGRMVFRSSPMLSSFGDQMTSEDGRCLISENELLAFAPAGVTEYTLPSGLKSISYDVFAFDSELQSIHFPEGLEVIGTQAFYRCSSLTGVTFPESLTEIGGWAFTYSGLTSVEVPENVKINDYAFTYCGQLTSAILPTSQIGDAAFCGDVALEAFDGPLASADHRLLVKDGRIIGVAPAGLTELTIPGSISEICHNLLEGLPGLKKVIIEEGVTTIGEYAFENCANLEEVSVPATVTNIGQNAFVRCNNLGKFSGALASADGLCLVLPGGFLYRFAPAGHTEYEIPNGITEIGYTAFYDCDELTRVTIPSSVVSIDEYAFEDCSALTTVTLSEGLQEIGEGAFLSCSSLTGISIPSTVTQIGMDAFASCTQLSTVTLHEGLQYIGEEAFGYCTQLGTLQIPSSVLQIGRYAFYNCQNLYSVILYAGVQEQVIGNYAFCACTRLSSIDIPSSVTRINDFAFDNCTQLSTITLREGLQEIGVCAFRNCPVQTITIPSTVTSIGINAFYGQTLKIATVLPTTPPSISGWVFAPNVLEKLYVPKASLDTYKRTGSWSWFDYSLYAPIMTQNQSNTEGVGEQDWN